LPSWPLQTHPELCYRVIMAGSIGTMDHVSLSATPTEEEIRAWEALSREEQLRRLRSALTHPDCATATTATMSDILAEARALADAQPRG